MPAHGARGVATKEQLFFDRSQSVTEARRAQHRLNFKPLPQGHGSFRRTSGLQSTRKVRGAGRISLSIGRNSQAEL